MGVFIHLLYTLFSRSRVGHLGREGYLEKMERAVCEVEGDGRLVFWDVVGC